METQSKIIIGVIIIGGILIYIYRDDIKNFINYKSESSKIDLIKNKKIDSINLSNYSDL